MRTKVRSETSEGDELNIVNVPAPIIEVQIPSELLVEPLSLLSSRLGEIAASITQLDHSHAEQMENAAARIRDRIVADLQNQYRNQVETAMQALREEFEKRMRSAAAEWDAERQSLVAEIGKRSQGSSPLTEEVAQTEATLEALQKKIREMLDDPAVELSRLMQENARQEELQAYLKGLKFNNSQGAV
jgi:exonuclease VII large subunit